MDIDADGTEPKVGDKVSIEGGSKADGDYKMPGGETYVVKEGVLEEIIPAEEETPEANEEIEALKAENEELKKKVAEMEVENEAVALEVDNISNNVEKVLQENAELKADIEEKVKLLGSNYKPPVSEERPRKEEEETETTSMAKIKARREERAEKNK